MVVNVYYDYVKRWNNKKTFNKRTRLQQLLQDAEAGEEEEKRDEQGRYADKETS